MGNGVMHWGINGANNGATPGNKNKTIYYYIAGATILLLIVKLLTSNFFRELIDATITYLPFVILLSVGISSFLQFRKNPAAAEEIKKKALYETFYLLLITLIFYILYSPQSFSPIVEAVEKIGRLFSLENYFLVLSYVSVLLVALALVIFFVKIYQKSKGTYLGTVREAAHGVFYPVFFLLTFLFISSIFTYPAAYAPVTGYIGNLYYSLFLRPDNSGVDDNLNNARISNLKSAISKTYENLKDGLSDSSEKLTTTITDTKVALDSVITRVNKDLKNNLTDDITDKLDLSGGTLEGDLTLEGTLDVTDTATTEDVLPTTDDTYDLGSVSKGWDNAYIHTLHGSSILTVGDGTTSHSMTDSDDLLVTGDFEVNGTSYLDGAFKIGTLTGILEAADGTVAVATAGTDYENPLTFDYSLARVNNTVRLSGDVSSPSPSYYYGTDSGGVKGYFALPNGGTTDHAALLTNLSYDLSGHTGFQREITAGLTLNGNLVLGTNTLTTSNTGKVTNLQADTTDGYSFNQDVQTTGTPTFAQLTIDNIGINTNTISTSTGDLVLAPNGTSDIDLGGSQLVNIGNNGTDFDSNGGLTLASNLDVNGTSNDIAGTLNLSGGALTSTGALTVTPASGSNLNVSLATTGDFVVNTSQFYVDTSSGYIGIGDTTPDDLLNVHSASAAAGLAITSLGTDTDAYVKLELADGTPSFMMGIDDSDSDRFKISAGTSLGLNDALMIDPTTGVTYINALQSGAQNFETDAGVVQWADLPVNAAATGTVESYSAMIDGNALLTIYAKSATSGTSISDSGVGIGTLATAPVGMLDVRQSGVKTAADYGLYVANTSTNATTDAINKYGAYVSSTGTFTGAGGTATNNYGIYLATTSGADTNIDILAGSGASLTTAGTWTNAPSYKRYKDKTEIGDTSNYLDLLMDLSVDEWQYKDSEIDGMNRYKDDPYRHASPYLDEFYTKFGLGTDKGVNVQDLAGVAMASIKELNTRFIGKNNEVEVKIADLRTDLQTQITELQNKTNTELNLAQIDLNKNDITLIKQTLGMDTAEPGDLSLIGKIAAKKIAVEEVETDKLVIKVIDVDAATIGAAEILAIETDVVDADGATTPDTDGDGVPDGDGVDDETGVNGKSVKVETTAVTENSKVFVTAKSAIADPLAVTKIKDGESFTVEVANPVVADLKFDWWIVDAK